jgi:DNA polymerase-3 subunit epsilon
MEFVAIDVETANADMASICQIGIAQFKDGTPAEEWKTYVDPQDLFDEINVSIHGIDEDVVAGSPTFAKLADTLISKLSGRIIVTHTAFDRVAVHQASTKHKTPPLSCTWLDTACVARRAWTEFSRRGIWAREHMRVHWLQFPASRRTGGRKSSRHDLDRGNDAHRTRLGCLAHEGSPTD